MTASSATDASATAIELSIVIPVYNEEASLERALRGLGAEVRTLERPGEILLCANGCVDQTSPIANELMNTFAPEIKWIKWPEPDYGDARRLRPQRSPLELAHALALPA